MSDPLVSIRDIITGLFPWIKGIFATPAGLEIRSTVSRVRVEGGDHPVALVDGPSVGTGMVRFYTSLGVLYVSTSTAPPYAWTPVAQGVIPPTPVDAGTAVLVVTASSKLSSG